MLVGLTLLRLAYIASFWFILITVARSTFHEPAMHFYVLWCYTRILNGF